MNHTGQNVAAAFEASLFEPGQPTDTAVIAEGVVMKAGFDPGRLEAQRSVVVAMIAEPQGIPRGKWTAYSVGSFEQLATITERQAEFLPQLHRHRAVQAHIMSI